MSKLKVLVVVVTGLALLGLSLFPACAPAPPPEEEVPTPPTEEEEVPTAPPKKEKVKIAIVDLRDLTGPYASWHVPAAAAHEAEYAWANETEYVPGVEFVYRLYDTGADPAKAVTAYKRAIGEVPRPVLVTDGGSPDALAIKELCKRDRVPWVDMCTNPMLQHRGSWMFTISPRNDGCAVALADYFLENLWKEDRAPRFAFVTWDNPYGRSVVLDSAIGYLELKGWEYMGALYIPYAPSDTMPQALQLKEWGVDFIHGAMYPAPASVVAKDCDRAGLTDKITFSWHGGCQLSLMVDLLGPLANGMLGWWMGIPRSEWPPEVEAAFLEASKTMEIPEFTWISEWAECATAIEAIRRAVEAVGAENVTGEDVYKAFRSTKGWGKEYMGVDIDFTEDLVGIAHVLVSYVENGEVLLAPEPVYVPDLWPGGKDAVLLGLE